MTTAPIFEHTVGSHSDDRGGDADARCSCQDTHTTHSDNLQDRMSELTIKDIREQVELITTKCWNRCGRAKRLSPQEQTVEITKQLKEQDESIMQLIDSAITEAQEWRAVADQLAEAIRFTREYVGEELLPNVEGWSHYDATQRYNELKNNTTKQEDIKHE